MWSAEEKSMISVDFLLNDIQSTADIEGITLLGGEPMHQAMDLLRLCKTVKAMGLSIFLYTGFELDELKKQEEKELLDLADIIVCGRYDIQLRNTHLQWRGSSNQKVIFNTDRYAHYQLDDANYCEVEIDEDGVITISGYPDKELLNSMVKD
ncbi:anaerobic ribonucleoside-triphosphate reductase activating protein [Bacillus tianshenii]|uniref:Anaerobic ribonucleoside-triphosphate reductase activating protein n=2 Tax=Sutcliffiella tianshenii TaxID=1463404 RepID=A0ABS2P0E5_9BACI|nr:anaerobic ribonucleoside-triphosphate reductase activating protein [Bacillus tianshenii]